MKKSFSFFYYFVDNFLSLDLHAEPVLVSANSDGAAAPATKDKSNMVSLSDFDMIKVSVVVVTKIIIANE